jgi:hypothetical protein
MQTFPVLKSVYLDKTFALRSTCPRIEQARETFDFQDLAEDT